MTWSMAPSSPVAVDPAAVPADAMPPARAAATSAPASQVCAVVVTLNPDVEHFGQLVGALACQVGHVFVVDNGSDAAVRNALVRVCPTDRATFVPLPSNQGIARAQNVGIRLALEAKAEFVLLSDHDSLPHDDMVKTLLGALHDRRTAGGRVAAVGPVSIDRRTGTPSKFVRLTWRGVRRFGCDDAVDGVVPADFLIASGCLIPADALEAVGAMNEGYFIDHVDTEWCLRARHLGWEIFGVCGARLDHSLGDSVIRVWLGRWREVPVHSPVRDYYMFRNTIFLLKNPSTSLGWALTHCYRMAQFFLFFGCFVPPRATRWGMIAKGIWHGLVGRAGKLQ
ncbi:glycosyltransferase family 2 protein [Cupriavidus respiraculi]|uniref:glycosyltransferase family 2 protein n=1 Tax=Cupriavidus respiraculi TaxID=195930 RepID=UPI001C96C417|nr:glycosyltransferase family 2 protein [Cupriavidus respiraculi]MBY4949085.1 glycosyltransferase family 2 protein [Cupriavidus respiraculi]